MSAGDSAHSIAERVLHHYYLVEDAYMQICHCTCRCEALNLTSSEVSDLLVCWILCVFGLDRGSTFNGRIFLRNRELRHLLPDKGLKDCLCLLLTYMTNKFIPIV